MNPIYTIQNGLGHQEHSVKVYEDYLVIRKPQDRATIYGMVKKELEMAGLRQPDYIGIEVPLSEIEEVEFLPARGEIPMNGLLVFYLKGKERKAVNFSNYGKAPNAIRFRSQYNDIAKKIKEYVDARKG